MGSVIMLMWHVLYAAER